MDDNTRAKYEEKAKEARASLKKWENDWADGHNGAKPGRQDIKDHPDIALQYKEYNKIREILAGKVAPPKPTSSPKPQKRRSDVLPAQTPVKRSRLTETPSKPALGADLMMNSPAISRRLFSPAPVTSIGPTPQRDGRVLGLFDLLVDKELGSPSKGSMMSPSKPRSNINATPSKKRSAIDEIALGGTPKSNSNRNSTFMTPLKKRDDNAGGRTPGSISKTLQFDTPAFLKRHSLPAVLENAADLPAPPLRLPRKPIVRGLSEIVASLRKVEDDQLDEELEALREMENEEMGEGATAPPPLPKPKPVSPDASILEKDSQALPLGGFDDEGMYDSSDEEQLGRDGLPLKVFKKKGQKRTTRISNMKPMQKMRPAALDENGNIIEGADEDDKDDKPKKPRKVNELAHANFKRLKLRSKGGKGGPSFGGRFRRR